MLAVRHRVIPLIMTFLLLSVAACSVSLRSPITTGSTSDNADRAEDGRRADGG